MISFPRTSVTDTYKCARIFPGQDADDSIVEATVTSPFKESASYEPRTKRS